MQEIEFTLDELVGLSPFSKRQIRYYITMGLVPGAGENRGPYAVYPREALVRLQRIAELKRRRVPPTGRRLTLKEIQHELDRVREIPEASFLRESAPEPDASRKAPTEKVRGPLRSATSEGAMQLKRAFEEGLAGISDSGSAEAPVGEPVRGPAPGLVPGLFPEPAPDPMRDLLHQLADQLLRLGQAPAIDPRDGTGRWVRIDATDEVPIEINIQHPTHYTVHERLEELAESLLTLLERKESR